jgi:hypothetical protein
MADIKPWYPTLETSKVFREHDSPTLDQEPPLHLPDANEDTAPLQGSKDLSDTDALQDVIAASYSPGVESEAVVISDNPKE